jgi:hypothetical protein
MKNTCNDFLQLFRMILPSNSLDTLVTMHPPLRKSPRCYNKSMWRENHTQFDEIRHYGDEKTF